MTAASDVERFAADHVGRLLQGLSFQVRRTLKSPDADAIHDLRVAIRRFEQALTVFRQWFASGRVRNIRRQLETILGAAGDVRDYDIASQILAKSHGHDAATFNSQLCARRNTEARKLSAVLRRWVTNGRGAKWRADLADLEAPEKFRDLESDELPRRVLPPLVKAFFESGNGAVDSKASGRSMHQLRIEAKKVRYSMELFQEAYGSGAKDRIEQLRKVQTLLGSANDFRAARKLLNGLGAGSKLADCLRKKQRKKTREFRSLWTSDFAGDAAGHWVQFFRQPRRKPAARSTTAGRPLPLVAAQ